MNETQSTEGGPGVLLLAGPTASGKSALALEIAEAFGGTIINADSMQVFREMRVLSARPTPDDERRAPHRLYGVVGAAESFSVADWQKRALAEVAAVRGDNRLPIVVGGTGLYFHVLTSGIAEIPDVPEAVRQNVTDLHARLGSQAFHLRLAEVDPVAAARIPVGDTQRAIRAFEVYQATGRSLSDWQARGRSSARLKGAYRLVALTPDRSWLYSRIDARFRRMMEDDAALSEVEALSALGLSAERPVMKALGVPELRGYIAGHLDREEAIEKAQTASRRYAKRQMTWIRNRMPGADLVSAQDLQSAAAKIFPIIRHSLLTSPD